MFLYNVAIRLYVLLVYLVSPFNSKARKLIRGRRNFFQIHQPDLSAYIWFHCASLGEFEQARPLIEKIKAQHPGKKILLSFFSSSGYEVRKNYDLADQVIYLPFDLAANANRFFGTFKISVAIFVKYDVWPNYLQELLDRKIPVLLTSAVFRTDHFYFRSYGRFLRERLRKMTRIYVQNKESLEILNRHGFSNVMQCGDVRVDRVMDIRSANQRIEEIERFIGDAKCFICGSVYTDETDLIHELVSTTDYRIIIAPHSVDKETIGFFSTRFPDSILMSDLKNHHDQRILIIDNVGILSKLYKYASAVYIGGGFGKSIHNILEPAVWNIPVYIGPQHHKFPEAEAFIRINVAFSEKNLLDLAKLMVTNEKEFDLAEIKRISTKWFETNSGATDLIYSDLSRFI